MNPTAAIDVDFPAFIAQREESSRQHFDGKTTDYCFSLDLEMRKRLATLKPLVFISKSILGYYLAARKQELTMQGIAVGPRQYPHIYAIAQECAERLGIGIPQVFILYNPVMNAYTLATEEAGDMVVIHSSLVESMTEPELKCIIGHECGHIHNLHSVYNNLAVMMSDKTLNTIASNIPGAGMILKNVATGLGLFLKSWSRYGEASCDRAGLICCGDLDVARHALAKLASGGGQALREINLEEYAKQLETSQSTPVRLLEIGADHPIVTKRVEMLRIFRQCEVLFKWRPEMRNDKPAITRQEADRQCGEIARVLWGRGGTKQ